MREQARGVRCLPRTAAGRNALLAGLVAGAIACGAPPPPAAEHPVAAKAPSAELQCGLVHRAPKTWVGFAKGMTLDDMTPAGIAAAAAVRAVDAAVCGVVQRGRHVSVLEPHRPQLTAAAAAGSLAVTRIWWDDVAMSRARLELQSASAAEGWFASLVRTGESWDVATFRPRPLE